MVRYAVAASVLVLATANASEIAIDGRGRFVAGDNAGRRLFSKVSEAYVIDIDRGCSFVILVL